MTRDVNNWVGLAASMLSIGLAGGCVRRSPGGDPNAPIEIRNGALGRTYLQEGKKLDRARLLRVLGAGSADVRAELEGQRAAEALSIVGGAVGGGLIGWPLGALTRGDSDQVFLIPIGASLATVALVIGAKADSRLHRAVLLHSAHHGVGDVSRIAPLPAPRTSWLLRSVFGAGYTAVEETIAVGPEGKLSMTGPNASYDWSLGYFVVPGLAVSGNLLGLSQFTSVVRSEAGPKPVGGPSMLNYSGALANVTYYPLPDLGLYAVGGVGYGTEYGMRTSIAIQPGASGIALTGGVGWDFTVANSGAVGVVVRGLYSDLGGTFERKLAGGQALETNFSDRWSGITAGLSVTYY